MFIVIFWVSISSYRHSRVPSENVLSMNINYISMRCFLRCVSLVNVVVVMDLLFWIEHVVLVFGMTGVVLSPPLSDNQFTLNPGRQYLASQREALHRVCLWRSNGFIHENPGLKKSLTKNFYRTSVNPKQNVPPTKMVKLSKHTNQDTLIFNIFFSLGVKWSYGIWSENSGRILE